MQRAERAVAFLIALLVLALYARTSGFGYVFDDEFYILTNPGLAKGLSWEGVYWSFTNFYHSNWHPIAWVSHLADRALFGPSPGPAHVVNASLHAICAALFFLVLKRITGALWLSALSAVIFAVHPLRVESVAWITERKDALSTIFWLLGISAWLQYARRPDAIRYAAVIAWFALALMTKPMVVTFPFALLLLDYWPLGRFRSASGSARFFIEKVPLLFLAAASSAVTYIAQYRSDVMQTWERYTFGVRLGNAVVSSVKYLALTSWPHDLAFYYPHPIEGLPAIAVAGATLLLATLTVGMFLARRQQPWLVVGWLWHLGTLVPAIGIIQVGAQAMADRYSYLPALGLLPAVLWQADHLASKLRRGPAILALAGLAASIAFSVLTLRQLDSWRDNRTLYSRALTVTKNNALAHYNLAILNAAEGRHSDALVHYHEATRISPGSVNVRVNYGLLLATLRRTAEAEAQYREALRLDPASAEAHLNYGVLLAERHQLAKAIEQYRAALSIQPDSTRAHMNLGNALDDLGRRAEAIAEYREALRLDPTDAEVHYNLGLALENGGRKTESQAEYREALRINPLHKRARERRRVLER